jgi:hypothetical protein
MTCCPKEGCRYTLEECQPVIEQKSAQSFVVCGHLILENSAEFGIFLAVMVAQNRTQLTALPFLGRSMCNLADAILPVSAQCYTVILNI